MSANQMKKQQQLAANKRRQLWLTSLSSPQLPFKVLHQSNSINSKNASKHSTSHICFFWQEQLISFATVLAGCIIYCHRSLRLRGNKQSLHAGFDKKNHGTNEEQMQKATYIQIRLASIQQLHPVQNQR
jgi:hypothetical protein